MGAGVKKSRSLVDRSVRPWTTGRRHRRGRSPGPREGRRPFERPAPEMRSAPHRIRPSPEPTVPGGTDVVRQDKFVP
jgi:hypothetical protein